jgi:hypothetical protein
MAAGVGWRFHHTCFFVCVCVLPWPLISIIIALLLSRRRWGRARKSPAHKWSSSTNEETIHLIRKEGVGQLPGYRYYTELSLLSYARTWWINDPHPPPQLFFFLLPSYTLQPSVSPLLLLLWFFFFVKIFLFCFQFLFFCWLNVPPWIFISFLSRQLVSFVCYVDFFFFFQSRLKNVVVRDIGSSGLCMRNS